MQKENRRDPTVPQRYRGSSAGLIHRKATKPPGSHRKCGENPGGLVDKRWRYRKIIKGDWKSDRASPTSQVGGCEARRRCCEVEGVSYFACLVKNPGCREVCPLSGQPKERHHVGRRCRSPTYKRRGEGSQGGVSAWSPQPVTAHCCPLLTAHSCLLSQLTAHCSQCMMSSLPLMCALLSLTATSHCLQEKTDKAVADFLAKAADEEKTAKEPAKKKTKIEMEVD